MKLFCVDPSFDIKEHPKKKTLKYINFSDSVECLAYPCKNQISLEEASLPKALAAPFPHYAIRLR